MKLKALIFIHVIFLGSILSSLTAGSFTFDSGSYTSSGIAYNTSTAWDDNTGAGFSATATDGVLAITGFKIRKNQKWKTLSITHTAGDYSFEVLTSGGQVVYSSGLIGAATTVPLDLSSYYAIENSSSFQLELTLTNTTTRVTTISVTYSDNSVICYPAPYVISSGTMSIAYDLPSAGKVTINIYDNGGRLVKNILNEDYQSAKLSRFDNKATWNGVSTTGRTVATGVYTVVVEVTFLGGSETNYLTTFRVLVVR